MITASQARLAAHFCPESICLIQKVCLHLAFFFKKTKSGGVCVFMTVMKLCEPEETRKSELKEDSHLDMSKKASTHDK